MSLESTGHLLTDIGRRERKKKKIVGEKLTVFVVLPAVYFRFPNPLLDLSTFLYSYTVWCLFLHWSLYPNSRFFQQKILFAEIKKGTNLSSKLYTSLKKRKQRIKIVWEKKINHEILLRTRLNIVLHYSYSIYRLDIQKLKISLNLSWSGSRVPVF